MNKVFKKKDIKIDDNVVKLNIDDKTVKKVIDFYNEAPFPNYENNDDKSSINQKGDNNYLAKQFKNFIGLIKIFLKLDVELVNFLYIFQSEIIIEFMH
jgi:hypothetical protein